MLILASYLSTLTLNYDIMSKYFLRACRYILRIAVLMTVVLMIMTLSGLSSVNDLAQFASIFASTRGLLFLALIFVGGFIYPAFSFVKTEVKCDISQKRESIVNAFASCNYLLETSEDGKMTFRIRSFIRRLNYSFDDRITVISDGRYIVIEGLRREVVRIEARLRAFMAL